jgi:hypothetical protein
MALSRGTREAILKFECGYSLSDLASNVREINMIKARRRQTMGNLQYSKFEEKLEAIKRGINRIVCARRTVDAELTKLLQLAEMEKPNILKS